MGQCALEISESNQQSMLINCLLGFFFPPNTNEESRPAYFIELGMTLPP